MQKCSTTPCFDKLPASDAEVRQGVPGLPGQTRANIMAPEGFQPSDNATPNRLKPGLQSTDQPHFGTFRSHTANEQLAT